MAEPGWRAALLLVAALHLLTTPLTWQVTDASEALFTARRLLDHGTLTLSEPGSGRLAQVPWAPRRDGEPVRSRLLPATALSLAPLLLLDRLLGWENPQNYGRLVYLQGHILVLGALALLGVASRRSGGSQLASAMAVALTGLAWPVWQASRRGGPEALLVFAVGLLVLAEAIAFSPRDARDPRRSALLAALALALMPWTNPTGAPIGVAALAALALGRLPAARASQRAWLAELRRLWLPTLAFAASLALLVAWNQLYHGNWWAGGYDLEGSAHRFGDRSALEGLGSMASSVALQLPVLVLVAVAGLRASRRPWERGILLPTVLLTALCAMFATFYAPEPARRLAPVWPAVGAVVGRSFDSLRWPSPRPQALLAAAGLVGFYWFMAAEGHYYAGPLGLFYPSPIWVKLAIDHGWSATWLLPVAALLAAAAVATARLFALSRAAATGAVLLSAARRN